MGPKSGKNIYLYFRSQNNPICSGARNWILIQGVESKKNDHFHECEGKIKVNCHTFSEVNKKQGGHYNIIQCDGT